MPTTGPDSAAAERMRVRAWFDETPIADYLVASDLAERYAAATARRFGLRTTIDPVIEPDAEPAGTVATRQR